MVEQRKAEGKSREEIKNIVCDIPSVILSLDFEIANQNKTYEGSVLWRVVVMDKEVDGRRGLITAYPCRPAYAYFLLIEKLHTSAAGKTPHP